MRSKIELTHLTLNRDEMEDVLEFVLNYKGSVNISKDRVDCDEMFHHACLLYRIVKQVRTMNKKLGVDLKDFKTDVWYDAKDKCSVMEITIKTKIKQNK